MAVSSLQLLHGALTTLAADPFVNRVADGNIREIHPSSIVVDFATDAMGPAAMGPAIGLKFHQGQTSWRIDKGANWTAFSRQLSAVVQICETPDRHRVWELIVKAGVGKVDDWAEGRKKQRTKTDAPKAQRADRGGGPKQPFPDQCATTTATEETVAPARDQTGTRSGTDSATIQHKPTKASLLHKPEKTPPIQPMCGLRGPRLSNFRLTEAEKELKHTGSAAGLDLVADSTDESTPHPAGAEPVTQVDQNTEQSAHDVNPATAAVDSMTSELGAIACETVLDGVCEKKLAACRAELGSADIDLNPSQRRAVAAALVRRCTLVQGPPGTGRHVGQVLTVTSGACR